MQSVFVVAGGGSGLGEAVVRRVTEQGGTAVIADLDARAGAALAAELGDRTRYARCDVTSEADAAATVRAAVEAFGRIDVLVNCAGICPPARAVGKDGPMALELFERVIRINLVGTFNMVRMAADTMQHQAPNEDGERGVVVNTASISAFEGQIGQSAYSASKAGVVGMTLPLAREFARFGVRVASIAPGPFKTTMLGGLRPEVQESLELHMPFPPRLGRPYEFAQLVQSIVENPMLNGETIRLDGATRFGPK